MFSDRRLLWPQMRNTFLIFTIVLVFCLAAVSSASLENRLEEDSQVLELRHKREIEQKTQQSSISDNIETRDKKAPRGFLGLRGKKSPRSSFLGLRGRRSDSEEYSEEQEVSPYRSPYQEVSNSLSEDYPLPRMGEALQGGERLARPLELIKRAPSSFLGLRGKKAPSGFLGLRGKKAPSSFLGLRGKKAPSSFLGLRGKKDNMEYDDVEAVLQALHDNYQGSPSYYPAADKRAPRGFLGLRGKKSSSDYPVDYMTPNEGLAGYAPAPMNNYFDSYDKRAPSRFLGLRG